MHNFGRKVTQFLVSEDGPTAVEYAVMLALILVACITVVTSGVLPKLVFWEVATGRVKGQLDPDSCDLCDLSDDGLAAVTLHGGEKTLRVLELPSGTAVVR